MAILIVEFLWQILQEGIGQFLIEASITERQKTGILLNNVAEKNLKSEKYEFWIQIMWKPICFHSQFLFKSLHILKKGGYLLYYRRVASTNTIY